MLSPKALADLGEAIAWISQENLSAAENLRIAVGEAAQLLGAHPNLGKQRPDLASENIRFLILRGFPYIVVYRANAIPPRILRVLHGARDLPEVLQDLEREGGV
ncbi:MAG: type II toxin-antitoxin system RelE/ParE family toxin [Alphaproteobacteria bacterium]